MKSLMIILMVAAVATALPRQPKHTDDFLTFWNFAKMEHYLVDHLDKENDIVTVESIAKTHEGNDIYAVKVSLPHLKQPKRQRPIVMVESGLHAREWIAPMANLYLIHMLVEHHPEYEYLLQHVDFLFVPMANPDGFIYSHEVDRNWNKNRRLVGRNCYGVDINRNFDFQFLPSSDPCDEHYGGFRAGSEVETQAIQGLLETYEGRIALYISLQAYGQQILVPYNYAPIVGENHHEAIELGEEVAKKIHSFNGRTYSYGNGARLLENPEHGTSSDYAYGAAHAKLAYTVKLPAGGETGYDVPEDQLDGILTETWFGFLEFAEHSFKQDAVPY